MQFDILYDGLEQFLLCLVSHMQFDILYDGLGQFLLCLESLESGIDPM
jgi:hypothetical protein